MKLIQLLPNWHIERAWADEELQAWWHAPVANHPGPVTTRIEVGDWFTHGIAWAYNLNSEERRPQLSIVANRTLITAGTSEGEPATFEYQIAHQIGGHYFLQRHERFTESGFFRWIPTAQQLWAHGREEWALELLTGAFGAKIQTGDDRFEFVRTRL
jgi:hypothetical protein